MTALDLTDDEMWLLRNGLGWISERCPDDEEQRRIDVLAEKLETACPAIRPARMSPEAVRALVDAFNGGSILKVLEALGLDDEGNPVVNPTAHTSSELGHG